MSESLSPEVAQVIAQGLAKEQIAGETRAFVAELDAAIIETLPSAIVATNADGVIVRVNDEAVSMFGYAATEMVGQPVEMLVPEAFRAAHPANRQEYAIDPGIRPMGVGRDVHGRNRNGAEFPVDVRLSRPVTSRGGYFVAIINPARR